MSLIKSSSCNVQITLIFVNSKEKSNFKLENINFKLGSDELLAIVGSVGSGKSSLLVTLLQEIANIEGHVRMNGKIFYVPQEPWVFSASVRQNIIFGKPYYKDKFNEVIKLCALKEVCERI